MSYLNFVFICFPCDMQQVIFIISGVRYRISITDKLTERKKRKKNQKISQAAPTAAFYSGQWKNRRKPTNFLCREKNRLLCQILFIIFKSFSYCQLFWGGSLKYYCIMSLRPHLCEVPKRLNSTKRHWYTAVLKLARSPLKSTSHNFRSQRQRTMPQKAKFRSAFLSRSSFCKMNKALL